jgi:hypothetical protein
MSRLAFSPLLLPIMFAVALAGCARETSHGTLSGTVTLDGAPLASGLIRFIPADGQTPSADATISEGKFTAKVPVGEKRISISAPKVVGQRKLYETPDSPTADVVDELLPARYNARSELTLTVTAGAQQKNFDLQSAP